MEAVLFFIFWIGAATIHTLIELRSEAEASRKMAGALAASRDQKFKRDRC